MSEHDWPTKMNAFKKIYIYFQLNSQIMTQENGEKDRNKLKPSKIDCE